MNAVLLKESSDLIFLLSKANNLLSASICRCLAFIGPCLRLILNPSILIDENELLTPVRSPFPYKVYCAYGRLHEIWVKYLDSECDRRQVISGVGRAR